MENEVNCCLVVGHPPHTRVFAVLLQLCVHVEYYTIYYKYKEDTLSFSKKKQYVTRTQLVVYLEVIRTDMLF